MTNDDLNRESYREPTLREAVAAADRMHAELKALRARLAASQAREAALVEAVGAHLAVPTAVTAATLAALVGDGR